MKFLKTLLPAVTAIVLVTVSCEHIEKVSDVPEIKFKSFAMYEMDTVGMKIRVGELKFNFIDGNADFGLDLSANPEDTINLFLIPYQKTRGTYDSVSMDIYGRKYGILKDDALTRTGQNKTIKGEIKLDVYYMVTPPFDTMRYDFYITDRAGNKSNVASTPDIGFR